MICETKRTVLCDDPPNDDTETEEEDAQTPVYHLASDLKSSLISDISVAPSLPPPPAHAQRATPSVPTFMCRSIDKLEVSMLSRVLGCLDMLDLVRARPVCRAWRNAIDCEPYFFDPLPYPSQRLWQQKGFEFINIDPTFKFALCPLTAMSEEGQIMFQSQHIITLHIHGEWGLLSALFLSFFGKKAVRRKARNELSARCVVKRKGQLLPIEVSGRAVESSRANAARGGLLQPCVSPMLTESDWDRHEIVSSDMHIIVFAAEEETPREAIEDPEVDFFENECAPVEDVLPQSLKVSNAALRLRRRIETEERLNGLESVVEYLLWEIPLAVACEPSDSRVSPLNAIPVEACSSLLLSCSSVETVLCRNHQHVITAISKALKQYFETDGFSVVALDSPQELPSLEQSLVALVNQVQTISSHGFELGLECLEYGKDTSAALFQTGSAHASSVLSTAVAGSRLLQSSLTFAVSSLQGWWLVEETKDSSIQGEEEASSARELAQGEVLKSSEDSEDIF